LTTQALETGETTLVPGQNPHDLEKGEEVTLSSLGFAADGRLHFLFSLPEGAAPQESSVLLTLRGVSQVDGEDGDQRLNRDIRQVGFQQDGRAYLDLSFDVDASRRGELVSLTGAYGHYVAAEAIQGEWTIPLTVHQVESKSISLSGRTDPWDLNELRLSPLGVVLAYEAPDMTLLGGYPLTVFLSDGTVLHPARSSQGWSAQDTYCLASWNFAQALEDVDQITGVAIGTWMIPSQNGGAGQGYWLSQLPE
jgi:hypothetical protein